MAIAKKEYIFEEKFKVRDYECDLQGIVNNANYQHYMEHTRHRYIQTLNLDFMTLTNEGVILVVAKAELQYKKDNWHFCDFDQKYYEQDDILTTYNAWNEELGMYETKTVNIDMVEVYINCEILFRIGDELYDEINEQTEQPLGVPVAEEALIEA